MAAGFTPLRLEGARFGHVAYAAGGDADDDMLHVYVEHDGTPWSDVNRFASDPTPRRPLALELAARDRGARLLLGRPCYFESLGDAGCNPLLWTHERYSPAVIASMSAALQRYVADQRFRHVVLVGYSGGGSVAWLMAARVPATVAVVTLAANLDTGAWTRLHDYSPLEGSLDPAQQPPLPSGIAQIHFAGRLDRNVPPSIVESFAARHRGARIVTLDDFDHVCCWVAQWPRLLERALDAAARQP